VERPRLLAALDRGLTLPLVLLSTPAGFGKTTLLGQWLAARAGDVPTAWVSVDERVGDLPGLLAHIVAAAQALTPGAGREALDLHRLPAEPDPATAGEALADSLLDLEQHSVLVLDDYHLAGDSAVHEAIGALLDHPPPRLHLVLATRSDPPLPLARLRARGLVADLRAADLRFRPDEARAFLRRALRGQPSPSTLALLEEGAEGWAAGLRLAALSFEAPDAGPDAAPAGASARETEARLATAFAGRRQGLALDFLLDDVVSRQPAPVQDFLLRTCVPERLCASLCDALLADDRVGAPSGPEGAPGSGGGAPLLEAVLQANLFLAPLEGSEGDDRRPAPGREPDESPWYRYHHQFREALRQRLRARLGRIGEAALHARAGTWFASHGLVDEALGHLLAGGDLDGAAGLVEGHVHPALDTGAWPALQRWLALLPEGAVQGRPALLLAQAWLAVLRGRLAALPPLLGAAQDLLDASPVPVDGASPDGALAGPGAAAERAALVGEADALRCIVRLGDADVPGALASGRRALVRLPDDRRLARGLALAYAAHCTLVVEGAAPAVRLVETALAGAADRIDAFTLRALQALASVHLSAGALHEALRAGRYLLAQAGAAPPGPGAETGRAWGHIVQGQVLYEWDDPAGAATHFAAALARRHEISFSAMSEATLGLALSRQAQGLPDEAAAALAPHLDLLLRTNLVEQLAVVHAFQARLALLRGESEPALRWLRAPGDVPAGQPAGTEVEIPSLTRVRALLATGAAADLAEAVADLEAQHHHIAGAHLVRREVEILALQALARRRLGQRQTALRTLERALVLAEPGGFVRTFVDLGPPLADLLHELAGGGHPWPYLTRLLAPFGVPPEAPPAAPDGRPTPRAPLPERLSERELDVLEALARRRSNKEIGAELGITELTVKHHASSLYGKLGARGRREAVRLAQGLGLLPAS
jgi:LuxR family maltose regulon positive regulatory protein